MVIDFSSVSLDKSVFLAILLENYFFATLFSLFFFSVVVFY